MATELKINITTHYSDAEKGFNTVTESVNKLRQELISTNNDYTQSKATEQELIQATKKYGDAISRELALIDQTKDGTKALVAMKQKLKAELTRVGLALGENSEAYKALKTALEQVEAEIQNTSTVSANVTGSFGKASKSASGMGAKILELTKNIFTFQLIMGPIRSLVNGVTQGLSDSIKVAAEAEQVFSKLSTVFTNLEDSAKSMAKSLSSDIGVAQSTAANALSTVGDLLQAQGMDVATSLSTAAKWVSQFQDIIAFKDINMTLEEFAQNFMSGAAGNLRNFRTFGSIVKESSVNAELAKKGLDQLTGSELELAKMTTRAEMALEQQANAMGATTREWDTMQSVTRRYNEATKQLKENIGKKINTAFKPLKSWLTEIIEGWNKATEAKQKYIDKDFTATSTYDENNRSDRYALQKGITATINKRVYGGGAQRGEFTPQAAAEIASVTGASVEQVMDMYESMYGEIKDFINFDKNYREKFEQEALKIVQQIEKETKSIEKKNSLKAYGEALSSRFSDFFENINTLSPQIQSSYDIDRLIEMIATGGANEGSTDALNRGAVSMVVAEMVPKFLSAPLEDFVSSVDLALGKVDESGMKQAKAAILEELYTVLRNQFINDGTLEEHQKVLDQIVDEYKTLTNEVQEFTSAWEDAIAELKKKITNVESNLNRNKYQHELELSDASSEEISYKMSLYDAKISAESFTQPLMDALKKDIAAIDYNSMPIKINALKSGASEYNLNGNVKDLPKTISGFNYKGVGSPVGVFLNNNTPLKTEAKVNNAESELYDALKAVADETYRFNMTQWANTQIESVQQQLTNYGKKEPTEQHNTMVGIYSRQADKMDFNNSEERQAWIDYQVGMNDNLQSVIDFTAQLEKAGLSEEEITQKTNDYHKALDDLTTQTYEATNAEIEAKKESAEDSINNSLNPFASMADSINKLQDNIVTALGDQTTGGTIMASPIGTIVTALLTLVSQTEAFQKIQSILSDYILPVLDSFLEPMLPLIDTIGGIFQSLFHAILVPLFPIIVEICAVLTLVFGYIKLGFEYVVDVFKMCIGNLASKVMQGIAWILSKLSWGKDFSYLYTTGWIAKWASTDANANFEKGQDELLQTVKDIRECSFDIKKNTENKDDWQKILEELYSKNVINEEQYYAGLGIHSDKPFGAATAGELNYVQYQEPPQTVTTYYGGVSIYIDGNDSEAMKETLKEFFEEQGIPYNYGYGK